MKPWTNYYYWLLPVDVSGNIIGMAGENISWILDKEWVITFSGTGAIPDYEDYDDYGECFPWHPVIERIKKVVIGDGITRIGKAAFANCENLEEVSFGADICEIGGRAFYDCNELKAIELPSKLEVIESNAFESTGLTTLNIPENLIAISDYAFFGCPLESIQVNENNKSYCSVDDILYSKDNTKLLLYPAAKTDTSFTVPEGVTAIAKGAFGYCEKLTRIVLPSGLTTIERVTFYNCHALEDITVPSSVTEIRDKAFLGCDALESFTMPSNIEILGNDVFDSCIKLKQLKMQSDAPEIDAEFDDTLGIDTLGRYICSELIIYYPQGASGYDTAPWKKYTLETYQTESAQTDISTVQMPTIAGQTYNGSACKPAVKINGLVEGTDFTVAYSNNTKPGTATITVTGIGAYKGTAKIQFNIKLAKASLTSASNISGGVQLQWKAVSGAAGYEIYRKTSGSSTYTKLYTVTSGSTLSYIDKAASQGTTYIYKIRAYYGSVMGDYSAEKSMKRLAQPSISVSNASNGITIKWNQVTGASGYNVYRKVFGESNYTKVKTITGGSTVSCTDTGAAAGKTYSYKINAYSGSSVSIDSAVKTVKRLTQPVITVKNDSKGVTVSWKKITGASGYYVYRKASGESSYKKVKTITSGSTLSYTNTGLTNGKNYSYKVTAYSDSGKYTSAGSSAKAYYRLDTPSISSLKNSSSKKMTVKWGKNTKAAGFEIQYGLKSSFSGASKVTVKSGSTVSKTISGLTKGKTYYVRIRSYKTVSGKKYYSAWSSVKSVKISK